MIEVDDVRKSFGALEVLKGVSMTVRKGEVVSVIGGSGSGKSTLLMCVNGLEPIQSGRILVDGTEVHADHYWDDASSCFCDECGHNGVVGEFRVADAAAAVAAQEVQS